MPVVSATLALHESLRPSLPDSTDPTNPLPQSVQLILQQAWDADPSARPSATELAMVLRGAVVDVDVDAVVLLVTVSTFIANCMCSAIVLATDPQFASTLRPQGCFRCRLR